MQYLFRLHLLFLLGTMFPSRSAAECFPEGSGFTRGECTCDGDTIHCLDGPLTEFPVVDGTYPDVYHM